MNIKEVCDKYKVTPDTLRYYEKIGVIPKVSRTDGGIRNYSEEDLKWVQNAICFRSAGMTVELLIEYVRLFKLGDETLQQRCDLLKTAREQVLADKKKLEEALSKLNYKISKYEEAVKTGVLVWDENKQNEKEKI